MNRYLILLIIVLFACKKSDATQEKGISGTLVKTSAMDTSKKIKRTEKEWKAILTPEQYHVLREKGTDAPFTGTLTFNKEEGKYFCAGCGNELFSSEMKFESNCGWPSFDKEIEGGKIKTKTDTSFGMARTEILCARCGSHLGHLFDDGPTSTGLRYCVNSTSLEFKKEQ